MLRHYCLTSHARTRTDFVQIPTQKDKKEDCESTEKCKKLRNDKSTHLSNNIIISNSHFSKTYLCHASGRGKGERGEEKKNSPLWRLRGRGDSLDPASHSSSAASALCRPKKPLSRPGRVLTLIPDTGGRPMAAFFFAIEGRVRKSCIPPSKSISIPAALSPSIVELSRGDFFKACQAPKVSSPLSLLSAREEREMKKFPSTKGRFENEAEKRKVLSFPFFYFPLQFGG